MKIDFKKPKYALPIIALPFLLLFYMIITNWNGKSAKQNGQLAADSVATKQIDQINPDMPSVSKDVADADIKDKFQSLKETYKYDKDYSALNTIQGKEGDATTNDNLGSVYTQEDIQKLEADRSLDSLKKVIEGNKKMLTGGMNRMMSKTNNSTNQFQPQQSKTPQEVLEELQKIQQRDNPNTSDNSKQPSIENNDRMQMFREQMRIVDSLQKANGVVTGNDKNVQENNKQVIDPSKDTSFKPLPVSLTKKSADGFNTVREFQPQESIRAILDQDEKVYAGSRIRIRLLDDINVGENIIPKGSYIYGVVSGFQSQRVNISISEIMYENTPLPVALDVFDNDGYLGLYVPGSNFREFTKEIGTQGTSGLSSVQVGDGDVTSSLIEKVFSTTGSSISSVIKKDKAFLKYNYIIYLKEKKK